MFNFKNLFKKEDPVCGMKEEKSKGINYKDKWFCSKSCQDKYKSKKQHSGGCCGEH